MLPHDWTLEKLMRAHASAPQNPGIANALFRAGLIEAWGRGIGNIIKACRATGTAEPRWEVEPNEMRLEFVFTEPGHGPHHQDMTHETLRHDRSRPESLKTRILRQLATGPMSKAELSRNLGQRRISGQLNTVIRQLITDGNIEYTIPENPRSRVQQYRLTDKGRSVVDGFSDRTTGART